MRGIKSALANVSEPKPSTSAPAWRLPKPASAPTRRASSPRQGGGAEPRRGRAGVAAHEAREPPQPPVEQLPDAGGELRPRAGGAQRHQRQQRRDPRPPEQTQRGPP